MLVESDADVVILSGAEGGFFIGHRGFIHSSYGNSRELWCQSTTVGRLNLDKHHQAVKIITG
jgi:hypothetical protein